MTIFFVLLTILLLVILIAWAKLNTLLAFLISSIVGAILLGISFEKIPATIENGVGSLLGSLALIVVLGAMFGKLVAESGAAQKIANVLMKTFGTKYIQWALMLTGFIVGIPLFYNVGFVLLVPLIFSIANQYKLPAVYIGVPLLAALSVTHGFLPPHPSPSALVPMFGANMGKTLILGLIVAIPSMIIAGPLFAKTLRKIVSHPLDTFTKAVMPENKLPGTFNSFFTPLLPVILIASSLLVPHLSTGNVQLKSFFVFLANPIIVMLIAVSYATFSLGIKQNITIKTIMAFYADAIKDISIIIMIIAGAGILKQVFIDSGVNNDIAIMLVGLKMNPLLLGWLIAMLIRVAVGSATVAGLTAAGIVAPLVVATGANPNLMVLAIGAGSLMLSHVNDSGFWMFKEYFNLSLKDTIRSWTVMESLVGLSGISIILLLNILLKN
ncbi:MAG: gluconate:H+ symporter [Paludibacter sp.]|nr:gluconate:H+ symporter [Paludibacter sp.]